MSYILDALRRADAQRERDPSRGIHAQPVSGGVSGRGGNARARRWLPALAVLLIGLSLAALGWWWFGRTPAPAAPVPSTPAATPAPPARAAANALPAPPAPAAGEVMPPAAPGAAAPEGTVGRGPRPSTVTAAGPGSAPANPQIGVPVAVGGLMQLGVPGQSVAAPAASIQTPAPSTPPVVSPPPLPPPVAPMTAVPLPAAVPPAAPGPVAAPPVQPGPQAPALADGSGLPKLAITGGVYSQNRAQRMLIVNGQVLYEGGEPLPGLVIEEIRPHTAVMRYRGQRHTVGY